MDLDTFHYQTPVIRLTRTITHGRVSIKVDKVNGVGT